MNANAQKWLDALRSGEFRQTTGKLYRESKLDKPSYCCLGVLCEVWKRAEGSEHEFVESGLRFGPPKSSGFGYLPSYVWGWAGLENVSTDVLVNMNDGGESFSAIADFIEESESA